MLIESYGKCQKCGHTSFTRYGSDGYFQFDMCPCCGHGYGTACSDNEASIHYELTAQVLDATERHADYPSLSGIKRLAMEGNRNDGDIEHVFRFNEDYERVVEAHYPHAEFSGTVSVSSDSLIVETRLVVKHLGDRFEFRLTEEGRAFILNGFRAMNLKLYTEDEVDNKKINTSTLIPILLLALARKKLEEILSWISAEFKPEGDTCDIYNLTICDEGYQSEKMYGIREGTKKTFPFAKTVEEFKSHELQ